MGESALSISQLPGIQGRLSDDTIDRHRKRGHIRESAKLAVYTASEEAAVDTFRLLYENVSDAVKHALKGRVEHMQGKVAYSALTRGEAHLSEQRTKLAEFIEKYRPTPQEGDPVAWPDPPEPEPDSQATP